MKKTGWILIGCLGFLLSSPVTLAKNLGVMGPVYPIEEPDFLQFIKTRVETLENNGQWQKVETTTKAHAQQYRDRPTPVPNVTHAVKDKRWLFDPSVTLDEAITTPEGTIIAAAGTRVNPLARISLSKTLIFYDADDT